MSINNPKNKITLYIPSLEGGGSERFVINFLKGFKNKNFKLTLILEKKEGEYLKAVPENVIIYNLNTNFYLFVFLKLIKYFKKENPDFFISFFPVKNIISLLAGYFSRTKTKIIISSRTTFSIAATNMGNPIKRFLTKFILPFLMSIIYHKADSIVCVSKGVAKDLSQIIGNSDKIKVIYNPIDNEHILSLAKEKVGSVWFDNSSVPVILAVGRLIKAKDYPTLIGAFHEVLKKRSVRLAIIGRGEEKEILENIVNNLGISSNVVFLGFQDNPYKYMASATIFVLSSIREGFPNVLIETMACGTPAISTNCKSGPNEIIENGRNGLLVPVGNEEALANAIIKLLDNPDLRKSLSKEGKKRVKDFYLEKIVNKYENLFEELIF